MCNILYVQHVIFDMRYTVERHVRISNMCVHICAFYIYATFHMCNMYFFDMCNIVEWNV